MAVIKILGILVDMLLDTASDVYVPYVTMYRKGIKQMITQCMNSIYGTMVNIILQYIVYP